MPSSAEKVVPERSGEFSEVVEHERREDAGAGAEDPRRAAEAMFSMFAQDFVQMDLVDRGRSLQTRGLTHPGMKLVLSPVESRHEKMLRALVTMVSLLGNRVNGLEEKVEKLEARMATVEGIVISESSGLDPDGVPDGPEAQEAGTPTGPGPSGAEGPVR